MILINIAFLVAGLVALILSSDLFVDASSSLAIKLKVPKMLIALTIAAFGTCAPELAISFNSIASGNSDMTIANVVGSCIVNILLIVGLAAIVKPIKVKERTIKKELPILVFVTLAFFVLLSDSLFSRNKLNGLSRVDALMLMLWFGFFIYYIISIVRKNKKDYEDEAKYSLIESIAYIAITLIIIVFASEVVVDNAVLVAEKIGISQKIITMTAIVIGTSLPELTMTVGSARKGEFDMAVGNIIGTNIFNICVVLGLPTLIYGGYTSSAFNLVDTGVVLIAAVMFYLFGRSDKELTRREGILMVIVFLVYYLYMFLS